MGAAHTPGPWEESGSRNIIRTKTFANERGGLSGGVLVAQFWTTPSAEDARLMAAAPELLEALREIVAKFDAADSAEVRATPLGINRARSAIAKAEGTPTPNSTTLLSAVSAKDEK